MDKCLSFDRRKSLIYVSHARIMALTFTIDSYSGTIRIDEIRMYHQRRVARKILAGEKLGSGKRPAGSNTKCNPANSRAPT